ALAPVSEFRRNIKVTVGVTSVVLQLIVAIALLVQADAVSGANPAAIYLLGNWSPPFGIVLMVDRLSSLMLLLTALLALPALVYSIARWDRVGVHFYAIFQLLLMGVNGAFLTNDLFNLFVFFEIMLAAS